MQGNAGQALFQTGKPSIISHNQNQGTSSFATQFTDATQVKGIDYAMMFDGNNWVVTQQSTGASVNVTSTAATANHGKN